MSGNNSMLPKSILTSRPWWIEHTTSTSGFNFKWQPFANGFRFDLLNSNTIKQATNHLEFHSELSSKSKLFLNLQTYSEINKENVFNFLPITFYIEVTREKLNGQLNNLIHRFSTFHRMLEAKKKFFRFHPKPPKLATPTKQFPITYDPRSAPQYSNYTMPVCHFAGHNLWLLKPTRLNRGRGIHVFRDIESLSNLLIKCCNKETITEHNEVNSFIIQKYIERPLLIDKRKFDIRVWVLITHEFGTYFFKEGYLRTSSTEYKIDLDNVDNKFVHLTNNAVQKHSNSYGNYEDGNQMSFKYFQKYLDTNFAEKEIRVEELVKDMKNVILKSILSVRKKMNNTGIRKYSFELFGYDFIIDQDFNVWLIEVNTNPCLEESSKLLQSLIPRMLDDAFRLTLDCIFPAPGEYTKSKKYPVPDYDDNENMWYTILLIYRELLYTEADPNIQVPATELKSTQIISLGDFKSYSGTRRRKYRRGASGKILRKRPITGSKKKV